MARGVFATSGLTPEGSGRRRPSFISHFFFFANFSTCQLLPVSNFGLLLVGVRHVHTLKYVILVTISPCASMNSTADMQPSNGKRRVPMSPSMSPEQKAKRSINRALSGSI